MKNGKEADYSKTGRQHPEVFSSVTMLSFLIMFIKSFCRLQFFRGDINIFMQTIFLPF